jgi:hypothetical protein
MLASCVCRETARRTENSGKSDDSVVMIFQMGIRTAIVTLAG